jgi:hypothetical protein
MQAMITPIGHMAALASIKVLFLLIWHSCGHIVQRICHSRQLALGTLVGASAQAAPPAALERRYALREVKAFRDAVLAAYGGRCAISRLPEPRLLDAAHIVMDAD